MSDDDHGLTPNEVHRESERKRMKAEKKLKDVSVTLARYKSALERAGEQIDTLTEALDSKQTHFGRNQRKKSTFDGYDLANNEPIRKFCRKLFSHHKFLHPSWSYFLPNDPSSLYNKIIGMLDPPQNEPPQLAWKKRFVPSINTALCDLRSETNKVARSQYLGE